MTPSPQLSQANTSESGAGTNLDWDVLGKLNGEDQAIALAMLSGNSATLN